MILILAGCSSWPMGVLGDHSNVKTERRVRSNITILLLCILLYAPKGDGS